MLERKVSLYASPHLKSICVLEVQMAQCVYMIARSKKSNVFKINPSKDTPSLVSTSRGLIKPRTSLW